MSASVTRIGSGTLVFHVRYGLGSVCHGGSTMATVPLPWFVRFHSGQAGFVERDELITVAPAGCHRIDLLARCAGGGSA